MYWPLRAPAGLRRPLCEAEPVSSEFAFMAVPPKSMNRRQGLVQGSRPWWRNPGIGRSDCLDRTVRQPDQVEGLSKVPPGEAVRGLRDDGNGTLKTGVLRGICLEISGERTQLFGDDVGDEILRRLAIERRIRNREVAGSALEWLLEGLWLEELLREALLLEGLRLEAEQKRHQIAEQHYELLQPYELLNVRRWRSGGGRRIGIGHG